MFHFYGLQGRVFSGSLDEWQTLSPVAAAGRVRRLAAQQVGSEAPAAGPGAAALAAYGVRTAGTAPGRVPLQMVSEVMSRPAFVLAAGGSVADAWQALARYGVGAAPVTDADGRLVGLAGRAELMPPQALAAGSGDPAAWQALLAQPLAAVMWSPVPALQPETGLRRAAELLLATGLPGAPVADDGGHLLGFVSRSDLLRAMVADPPLDLWG